MLCSFCLFILGIACLYVPNVEASANLVQNASLETAVSSTRPRSWSASMWGNLSTRMTYLNTGYNSNRSVRVEVTKYTSGDARWNFAPVAVTPNSQYNFSVYYRSNTPVGVNIETKTTNGTYEYNEIAIIEPSSNWNLYQGSFTTSSNAQSLVVYLPVDSVGYIESDQYTLTKANVAPPSTTFNRPIVSIEFDDGWSNAYTDGFPVIDEFGFKATQNIITGTTQWSGYMTDGQIQDLYNRGHKIGSHTVSHPDLTKLNQTQLTSQLRDSQQYLNNLGVGPVRYIATPYCAYNSFVQNNASQYYSAMRNCDGGINTKSNFNSYNINSRIVLNSTTPQEISAWINDARKNNGWLILVYHNIRSDVEPYSITQATLRNHLQQIKNSGITVIPSQQAFDEVVSQI